MRKNTYNDFYYMVCIDELYEKANDINYLEQISKILKQIRKYKIEKGINIKEVALGTNNSLIRSNVFGKLDKFTKNEIELVRMHSLNIGEDKYISVLDKLLEENMYNYDDIIENYGQEVFDFIDEHRDNIIIKLEDKFHPQRELDTSIYYLDENLDLSYLNLYEEDLKK